MKFTVQYTNIIKKNDSLSFEIHGNPEYGLDKTIINCIRRYLLTKINTIGFKKEKIHIINNNTSLNNEFIKDRISLLFLNINPTDYTQQYLFQLNKQNKDKPILKIYSNDFTIHPLKPEILQKIKEQKTMDYVPEQLKVIESINNYDLTKTIPEPEKKQILKPYVFNKKDYYPILLELKFNNSQNVFQSLELNCIPSIHNGDYNANFNNVTCSTYSFKVNEKLANEVFQNNLKIHKIKPDDIEEYKLSFQTSEYDRYYYRDNFNEPYWYNFIIESQHFYDQKTLWKQSIQTIQRDLTNIQNNLQKLETNPKDTKYTITNDELKVKIQLYEDESVISMIQSHIVQKKLNSKSLVSFCGYKKEHPLKDNIHINLLVQPNQYSTTELIHYIINFMNQSILEIIDILRVLDTTEQL